MTRLACLTLTLTISATFAASFMHDDRSLQTVLERKITVTENKTIFTLFCLLNLGGYDEENNPAGMHPVRVLVRQQLAREVPPDLAKRIGTFYGQHKNAIPYDYSVVAMSTSGPTDFKFTSKWPEVKKLASAVSQVPTRSGEAVF